MSSQLQGATNFALALSAGGFATHAANIVTLTANTITYMIGGRFYSRAAVASIAWTIEPNSGIDPRSPNAFQNVRVGQACAFALILDAAGNFTIAQGPLVPAGALTPLPAPPANKIVVGVLKIVNTGYDNSGLGYRPGTDAHNSSGLTRTFADLAGHIDNI